MTSGGIIMKQKRCIIVIPAHNEEASIATVIAKVPRRFAQGWSVQIIVVDDGSSDRTAQTALEAGADFVYSFGQNRGLGAAVYFGLKQAYKLGADAAVMIDADDEYPADEIPAVVEPILNNDADYVIGSRFMKKVNGMKMYRRLGNRVFTWLQCLALRKRIIDGQSGFRAFSRDALRDVDIIHDYNYAQVMTLNLVRQGFRLKEVPIHYKVRTTGESFIRWNYILKVIAAMFKELSRSPSKRKIVQAPFPFQVHKNIENKTS
jgi:glycosyltransferase involved in cell wall biosynthesis